MTRKQHPDPILRSLRSPSIEIRIAWPWRVGLAGRFRAVGSAGLAAGVGLSCICVLSCGRGDESAEVRDAPARSELPNPFTDLRPRSGDVLVPPQIGFRWRWTGASKFSEGDAHGLTEGEFSSVENGPDSGFVEGDHNGEDSADGLDAGDGRDRGDEEPQDETDEAAGSGVDGDDDANGGGRGDNDEERGAEGERGASGGERGGDGGGDPGDPDDPEGLAGMAEGDQPSESERVDAYPNGGTRSVRATLPEDALFRVVMVDSIGAVYAQVVTTSSSIRVPLPPNTGPGPYSWHVELLSRADSSTIAQSLTETFEIH